MMDMELAQKTVIEIKEKDMTKEKIGDYLRNIRESKNIKLVQIADQTKINMNVLKRLEDSDFENLPNKAYVRGFVSNYIRAMKGNRDEALEILEKSFEQYLGVNTQEETPQITETQTKEVTPAAPIAQAAAHLKSNFEKLPAAMNPSDYMILLEKARKLLSNKKIIIPTAAGLFFIYITVSIYNYVSDKVETSPKIVVDNQVSDIKDKNDELFILEKAKEIREEKVAKEATEQATQEAETTTATVEDRNIDKIVEELRAQEIIVQMPADLRNGRVVREKTSEHNEKFPYVKFTTIKNINLFEMLPEAAENTNSEIIPDLVREAFIPGKQNVFIHAIEGDSWLTFKIENKEVKSLVLRQGKMLFLQGDQVQLFMGNVNVTKIFYNNQLIKVTTRSGVKSLIFPVENATNFVLPLFVANKDAILYTATDYQVLMDEDNAFDEN